jgi:hypothetical protein
MIDSHKPLIAELDMRGCPWRYDGETLIVGEGWNGYLWMDSFNHRLTNVTFSHGGYLLMQSFSQPLDGVTFSHGGYLSMYSFNQPLDGVTFSHGGDLWMHSLPAGVYGDHLWADGVLSTIKSRKSQGDVTVYTVVNRRETEVSYVVQRGDLYSHGATVKQATDDLRYKISDRDTSKYDGMTLDTEVTLDQAIQMYRVIAGACESQTRAFVESHDLPEAMTIKQAIEITRGQYNSSVFEAFFVEVAK